MKTGWYSENEYIVVKPLKNKCRQSLIIGAIHANSNHWYLMAGIFSCNATYNSMMRSKVWENPSSTNKNPSIKTISLALEALNEIEQEIHNHVNGKKAYLYADGLDERRLRVYTKILTKRCGYKKSTALSKHVNGAYLIYKKI